MSSTVSRLADLRGLEAAKNALGKLLATGSESHAVLFYGAQGAGKRSLAEILAQAWLCLAKETPGCGECRSCLAFGRNNHPDVLRISPWGPSSIIKTLAIRELPVKPQKDEEHILPLEIFFRSGPLVGFRKVVIMRDADRMNITAANALLKTLEEPPPFGRLVLTTQTVRQLPPTIMSRCLGIACELPDTDNPDDELWRLASGSPGRWNQMDKSRDTYLGIDQFAQGLSSRQTAEALVVTDEFRAITEGFEGQGNARASNAEAVSTLATALTLHQPDHPEWAMLAAEAHRRIIGNGSAGYALDAMFAAMLA